jgi:hypothetical protein
LDLKSKLEYIKNESNRNKKYLNNEKEFLRLKFGFDCSMVTDSIISEIKKQISLKLDDQTNTSNENKILRLETEITNLKRLLGIEEIFDIQEEENSGMVNLIYLYLIIA